MASRSRGSGARRSGPLGCHTCWPLLLAAAAALGWSSAAGEGGQRSPKIFIYDLPANMSSICSFNNQP
jgi:hypothetical protein